MADFDPYRKWLGIPPHEQPPNYYRLLGLSPFESDRDVIANAADRQMAHLRTFQGGKNSAISQKILNEVAAARICLLDPKKRAEYDARLQAEIAALETPPARRRSRSRRRPPIDRRLPKPTAGISPRDRSDSAVAARIAAGDALPPFSPAEKNRWQGPMVTLIVAGIGLLIAGWFIYIAVGETLFEPQREPKRAVEAEAATREDIPEIRRRKIRRRPRRQIRPRKTSGRSPRNRRRIARRKTKKSASGCVS